ncbi:MAG: diacylglycerol kinase family protein [Bacteroidetes bacterium]|nr:diacylglycerol kinase family protein [Bacteroidota bacterium]
MKPLKYAYDGLVEACKTQLNMKIHLVAMILVILTGILLDLTTTEWVLIAFCIGMVISTELVNTALEYLVDLVSPEHNIQAGKVKDIAAAAVLIVSVMSLLIGLIIFAPKLLLVFR